MDRRTFLQSLAALGSAIALPVEGIASAPDTVVDEVWARVLAAPATIYVNEYGALSSDPVEVYPATRRELLGYDEIGSRAQLIALVAEDNHVEAVVECEYSDPYWFIDDETRPEDWNEWLLVADEDTIERLIERVNDWINDTPDERDYERADIGGCTGRGNALRFFRDEFEYCADFDIVIVEGDCPGSSYFAAELHMGIAEANAYAAEFNIPIRFAEQG